MAGHKLPYSIAKLKKAGLFDPKDPLAGGQSLPLYLYSVTRTLKMLEARGCYVTNQAIREWEKLGILRTFYGHRKGERRVYTNSDIWKMSIIFALRLIGLSLRQIKDVIDCVIGVICSPEDLWLSIVEDGLMYDRHEIILGAMEYQAEHNLALFQKTQNLLEKAKRTLLQREKTMGDVCVFIDEVLGAMRQAKGGAK